MVSSMASIHRKKDSVLWHCAFYLPNGRRTLRSTGTSDKRKALQVCLKSLDEAMRQAADDALQEIDFVEDPLSSKFQT